MSFLKGKRALIIGLASNRSIAYGIAQAMYEQGAEIALTYQNERLKDRVEKMGAEWKAKAILPCDVSEDAQITNISALGQFDAVQNIVDQVQTQEHLVAYRGGGMEATNVYWLDIHHSEGSKGAALLQLKADLGASNVLCFGDSDNDLSMFETADEAYAPENSLDEIKAAATSVIGHHDDDGIAHFLRERFSL